MRTTLAFGLIALALLSGCGGSTTTIIETSSSSSESGGSGTGSANTGAASSNSIEYFTITSGAMEPTLKIGSRIAVDLARRTPRVGDIIAFHPPAGAEPIPAVCGDPNQGGTSSQACDTPTPQESTQTLIKRVVGLPGDRISIRNGDVYGNGVEENAPYAAPCGDAEGCNMPNPIVIPSGDYFVLGDNRGLSDDSRFWGPVPGAWIIGTVRLPTS